jgi:hypothetical protein
VRQISSREEGRAVRIAGWILLLLGLALCLSVVWAPLGLLLMGVGLVALQLAERSRRRAGIAPTPAAAAATSETPAAEFAMPRAAEAVVFSEPRPIPAPEIAQRAAADKSSYDKQASYDKEAWGRLVEGDSDLAQLAAVLADYGQQYVDEFASSYLEAPDKTRIAAIVDGIVARARRPEPAQPIAAPEPYRPPTAPTREPEVARPRNDPKLTRFVSSAPEAVSAPPAHAPKSAVEPPAKVEVSSNEVAPIVPAQVRRKEEVTREQAPPVSPIPDRELGSAPIISVDDDLTELIEKFAPDSTFLRRT